MDLSDEKHSGKIGGGGDDGDNGNGGFGGGGGDEEPLPSTHAKRAAMHA